MIHMEILDFKRVMMLLSQPPVIANDIDTTTLAGKTELNRLLYTLYDGNNLNVVPSCHCGAEKGGYNVEVLCTICHTTCESPVDRPLESNLWVRVPSGVRAFVNPTIWIILSNAMKKKGTPILEWLCDPTFKVRGKPSPKIKLLETSLPNFKRGLNYFHDNFDAIIDLMFRNPRARKVFQTDVDILELLDKNRDKIFTEYLPLPSKVCFVVESNETGRYTDKEMLVAIDALNIIASTDYPLSPLPVFRKESRTTKAMMQLATFYHYYVSSVIATKPGLARRHIFGGRLHFTARAVITSISEPHDYDDLHLPWALSVNLFKLHLQNKLLRMGWGPKKITTYISTHTNKYSEELAQLMADMIMESPHRGIPVVLQRNPTLQRAAAQQLFVTRIKKDPLDNTISTSVLVLRGFNADYDGDELNLQLILDYVMFTKLSRLAPHMSAFDMSQPRKISSNLAIPAPVISTIASRMAEEDEMCL